MFYIHHYLFTMSTVFTRIATYRSLASLRIDSLPLATSIRVFPSSATGAGSTAFIPTFRQNLSLTAWIDLGMVPPTFPELFLVDTLTAFLTSLAESSWQ